MKDKTLNLNIFDQDVTPSPIPLTEKNDRISWESNKIKIEERNSIKQFKVGSKERYEEAQKNEVESEKPKQKTTGEPIYFTIFSDVSPYTPEHKKAMIEHYQSFEESKVKQDPEILELYAYVENFKDLDPNLTEYHKFGEIKLTPKQQIVDAFFAKVKEENVLADLPLDKDKNQEAKVDNYEKLEKGVISQKITLVAECDNLEGKEVGIYIYEKKPLLEEEKDIKLKVLQNDKEVEKIIATVKDGYAVAEFEFQQVDSVTYKAWDTKLNPTTGETEISELYIQTSCTTLEHPGTIKNFLKEDKKYFKLKGLIEQHIYHNGEISKEEYDQAQKVKFIYHDKTDNEHNLGTFEITWAQAWLAGTSKYEQYVKPNPSAWKKVTVGTETRYYSYDDKRKAPIITPYTGTASKKRYVYEENDVKIILTEDTSREYYNPVGLATVFGALAEVEYEDVVSNGSVDTDGTGAYSVTHVNGFNADFKYLRKDKKRGNIDKDEKGNIVSRILITDNELDVDRQNKFLDALHKSLTFPNIR